MLKNLSNNFQIYESRVTKSVAKLRNEWNLRSQLMGTGKNTKQP